MSAIEQTQNQSINNFLRHPNIDEYIFISLIAASFVGELIMNSSIFFGFLYWLAITPFFFAVSLLSEKVKSIRTGRETRHLVRYELFYWGSAFVAVILVVFLWDMERVGPSEASIFIHIILAHTMFLTGIVLGLKFYLIGILLFLTAFLSMTTSFSLGFSLDVLLIVFVTWLGLKIKTQFILPTLKRESDFTKSKDGYPGKERRSE
ncbi:MAG: hypothetical protein KAH20_01970 [Methylococcales bacterium]|nr:hypothetical protein [Methylococcales bacterium]